MQETNEYDVYVIFHGALAFHEELKSSVIDVYAPEVIPHVYRAGSWLTEYDIRGPRQLLILTGVDPAPAGQVNSMRGHDSVINIPSAVVPGANYRAKFRMPRPAKIFYRKKVTTTVTFGIQADRTLDWALVPVFAYPSNGAKLELTGKDFYWTPQPAEPSPITLHIWATAEKTGDDDGPNLAAELFGESISFAPNPTQVPERDDKIPDLDCPFSVGSRNPHRCYEVDMLLHERMDRLEDFSARLRSGLPDPTFRTDNLTSHTTCGPVGGGG